MLVEYYIVKNTVMKVPLSSGASKVFIFWNRAKEKFQNNSISFKDTFAKYSVETDAVPVQVGMVSHPSTVIGGLFSYYL